MENVFQAEILKATKTIDFTTLAHWSVGKLGENRDAMVLRNTPLNSDGFHPFLTWSFFQLAVLQILLLVMPLPMADVCFRWFISCPKITSLNVFCKDTVIQFLEKSWQILPPEAESLNWVKVNGFYCWWFCLIFNCFSLQNNPVVLKVHSSKVLQYFFGHHGNSISDSKAGKGQTCKTEKKIDVIIIAIRAESRNGYLLHTF